MKTHKLLLVILAIATACSKSDSPAPALESTKVTATTVVAPTALTSSTDPHAEAVAGYINSANALTSWTSYFGVAPSGATKSSTPITASNGRVANTASTTVTYTWTDQQSGNSVGYQVTDDGTSYTWEFFYKFSGTDVWVKYLDANEKKDGSQGYLRVLDAFGSDPKVIDYRFDWTKTATTYTFKWTFGSEYFNLTYNLATKAGEIDYYSDAVKTATYIWDGTGHGTWSTFDSQGGVTDTGTW